MALTTQGGRHMDRHNGADDAGQAQGAVGRYSGSRVSGVHPGAVKRVTAAAGLQFPD